MENSKTSTDQENFKIMGSWNRQANRIRQNYSQLTDADLKLERGKEEELIKRLGVCLNKNREEIIDIIKKAQPIRAGF